MVEAYRETPGVGSATIGATGLFVALGVGLALLAFAAALFVGGDVETQATAQAGGVLSAAVAVVPFVAAPILAVVAGAYAGAITGSAGRGAAGAVLGTLVGMILMVVLIVIGLAVGAAIGGNPDIAGATEALGVNTAAFTELQFFATVSGLTYGLVLLVVAAIAGAIAGAVAVPPRTTAVSDERGVARGTPRV